MSRKVVPLNQQAHNETVSNRQTSTYDLIPGLDAIAWTSNSDLSKVTFVSENTASLTGFTPKEWITEPAFFSTHMNPDGHDEWTQTIEALPREQSRVKFEHRAASKHGMTLWFRTSIHVVRDSFGKIQWLHGLSVDITDYKRSEITLERSLKELEEIKFALDQASVVAITDINGVITYANDKFCELSGYSREELLGRTHRIFKSGRHPKEFYEDLWATIKSGHIWRGEVQNQSKTGELYWTFMTIVPFLDTTGKPYQFVAIRTDISALKQAEEERLRLIESRAALALAKEAIQARDRFVSMAAHEIKTPITSLQLLLNLLQRQCASLEKHPKQSTKTLETAAYQTRRLTTLINDMLDVTRISAGKIDLNVERVNLPDLVRNLIRHFEEDFRAAGCEVRFEDGKLIEGLWDRQRIEQVIINLLTNAMKYGHGRPIRIRVEQDGRIARFKVMDQGLGLSREAQQHLFQRFERADTAKHFKGFGLGLWISKQIVDAHKGTIRVESEEGKGATFVVDLPLEPMGL